MESQNKKIHAETDNSRRLPIHVKLKTIKRVIAISRKHEFLTAQNVFDATLLIGLKKLEGGDK